MQNPVREALAERLRECQKRIGDMCDIGRPPKMSIPADPNDDDLFICETLKQCEAALALPAPSEIARDAARIPREPPHVSAALRELVRLTEQNVCDDGELESAWDAARAALALPVEPDWGVLQNDLAAILRALELGDHARPQSPHQVVHNEVLPTILELVRLKREHAAMCRLVQSTIDNLNHGFLHAVAATSGTIDAAIEQEEEIANEG